MSIRTTNIVEMRLGLEVFDVSGFVEEFVWTESLIKGGFSWSIRFNTNGWNEWNDLILGQDQPEVRFRLRSYEEDVESSTEWKRAVTDWARASFNASDNMTAMIYGADHRLLLAQKSRTRAWPNSTVHEIVQAIGVEYGFLTDVTATTGRRDRWQIQESDWSFMKRLADNTEVSGRGDVFLWLDEQTLRLKTVVSQDRSIRRHDLGVIEGRMDGFTIQYSGRGIDRLGGATLLGIGFDFETKKGIPFLLNRAQSGTHPALADRVPRRQDDGFRYLPVAEDNLGTVREKTRGHWGTLGPRYLSLRAATRADVTLVAGKVIEVIAPSAEGRETPLQGRYHLLEVVHRYEKGDTTTNAVGYRREMIDGAEIATGASADNVGTNDRNNFGNPAPLPVVLVAEQL